MPAEVRALLEAAGVQDAMPPGPPAPVDLEPRSYYETAGPDWVWGDRTEGACTTRDRLVSHCRTPLAVCTCFGLLASAA